jgi:5'-3' exonuclease
MGIENFFNTLVKTKICPKSFLKSIDLKCDYLFIDFNSIIYIISSQIEYEINYYLYALIINEKDDLCLEIEKDYEIKMETVEEFKTHFTQDKIDNIIKEEIYIYIKKLCCDLDKNNNLKEIFISFDGTPPMAKISEQRRRKYMSFVMSCMKNNIYQKYGSTIDDKRNIHYDYVISFSKKNTTIVGAWSNNIQEIFNNIDSFEFKLELKMLCKKLETVSVSSAYEFGEGEKKIMEHILHYNKSGSYVIFSPDSDTVLLSLIMQNKLLKNNIESEFNVIRYNENEEEIENISINLLKKNILDFIYTKFNPYRKYNHNQNNIIDDIIALFTFFGNDFLPKIESINIRNGLNILLDIYVKHFNNSRLPHPYLLIEDKIILKVNNQIKEEKITRVNFDVLKNIINKLAEYEDKLIFDKYISNEYKNFNYLLGILEPNNYTPFFIDKLNRYCHGFNKVIRYIKSNNNTTVEEVYNNIINHFTDKEQWEKEFMSIENKDNYLGNITILELINIIIDKIKSNVYKCGLKLIRYSNYIEDKYHQNYIKEQLAHPKMNVSKYDIELYKLEKKMDEYKNIGYTNENKIGICDLKYKENEYKIHTDRSIINKKDIFYKEIMQCDDDDSKNELVNEYLKGFFWTIDYYFNKNKRQININYISTWCFKYNHSPYFKEISEYINNISNRNIELNKLFYTINSIDGEYYVTSKQFINKLEQYLYVTPKAMHTNIPEIYKTITDNDELFPDLINISNRVFNGEQNLIETYDCKFLTKANIIGIKNHDYNYYETKIINLRNEINLDMYL